MNKIIFSLISVISFTSASVFNTYQHKGVQTNIENGPLQVCSLNPKTGWFRDGYCNTGPNDSGTHVVCAEMTQDFLTYTKSMGNDLSTPNSHFPGLKTGDKWCLCALRWLQAKAAGHAPKVFLAASQVNALKYAEKSVYEAFKN